MENPVVDNTSGVMPWIGWGVAAVALYLIVSNTFYLLVGARLLQFLPGVNIKGFQGTVRLSLLLVILVSVSIWWVCKRAFQLTMRRDRTPWKDEIATGIKIVAKVSNSMTEMATGRVAS
jgi:hypothetical protein